MLQRSKESRGFNVLNCLNIHLTFPNGFVAHVYLPVVPSLLWVVVLSLVTEGGVYLVRVALFRLFTLLKDTLRENVWFFSIDWCKNSPVSAFMQSVNMSSVLTCSLLSGIKTRGWTAVIAITRTCLVFWNNDT